jgi:O-antigen/teichoic acid export membrane protein
MAQVMTEQQQHEERTTKTLGLTHRFLGGFFWTFSGLGFRGLLELLVTVVLARLLTPREFGVMASAVVVMKCSEIFSQFGIAAAMVQRPDLEARHVHAGFLLSCCFGAALTALIFLLAPGIAQFFRMDELAPPLRLLSSVYIIQGVSLTAESLLQRKMKFRLLVSTQAVSYTFGYGVVAISLALWGLGIWALVWGQVLQSLVKSVIYLAIEPHSKSLKLELRAVKDLLSFGGGLTITRICNSFAGQGDNLVIGRLLGAEPLGLYGRAYQLMVMPANLFGMALDQVLFPVMAKVQTERDRLRKAYERGVALIALMVLPVSVTMCVLAPEIVMVLFGPKWSGVVLPFQILAVGMLFRTSYKMGDSLARATGAVYGVAWRHGLYAVFVVGGTWIGQFWGLPGASFGVLGAIALNFMLMAHLSQKLVPTTWKDLVISHLAALPLTGLVLAEVSGLTYFLRAWAIPPFLILSICIPLTLVTAILLARLVPGVILGKDGIHILQILCDFIPNRYNLFKRING